MARTPGYPRFRRSLRRRARRGFLELGALGLIALLAGSCGGESARPFVPENDPPIIRGIFLVPNRVHAAEEISVRVDVVDPDDTDLRFRWDVTRGTFPLGRTIRAVQWNTALELGFDTLRVRVTDLEDTVYASLPVELVLPAPPARTTTTNFSNLADVTWPRSIDDGIDRWTGYLLYSGPEDLRNKTEEELGPFLLTAQPTRDTRRRVLGLETGVRYFFHVRSVRTFEGIVEYGELSVPAEMSPRPENLIAQLFEAGRFNGGHGVDVSTLARVAVDPGDPSPLPGVDVYVGTTDALDGAGGLQLKSVSLLANRDPAWGAREVLIKELGDDWAISTTTDDEWLTAVPAARDRVYAVKTPEGHYAKLRITDVQGAHPNRSVRLQVAYQTLPDYPSF